MPVSAGCAAAPRFIQLHPRLLKLHPLDLATYVLLCERTITGLYPAGVPLSGADLARFFEANESMAASTRYNRSLKRLAQAGLVVREPRPGRKACYQPQWPGTQRREPTPLSEPYPHRLFVPIYLRLFEQFIGTFHPTESGPAEIERFVETPSLDPVALHAWACARWAAWHNEPTPDVEPDVVTRLRVIGLWDDTGVYDPEQPQTPVTRNAPAPTPAIAATVDVAPSSNTQPAQAAAWTMLDLMAQQMKLMQEQIVAMQQILLGDSSTPIIAATADQPIISASQSLKPASTTILDSANTDSNSNTEINTEQTQDYLHPQTPNRRRRSGGGGDQHRMSTTRTTEAEQLLREAGVIASNARRFAERRPEQVQAAINFAKKSNRRFDDPAGMIVWLLDKNEFSDAHEQPDLSATNDEALNRCWYCGKSGCTTCKVEHEQRLMARWGGAEFDGGPLWHDLQAVAREALPGLPVDAAEAQVVRHERLILVADEEPAMALRAARSRLIELAARSLGVKVDIVITRRPQEVSPLPLPIYVAHGTPADASQTQHPALTSAKEPDVPLDAAVVADADDALQVAAAGLPELVRALFRGARMEPDAAPPRDTETFYLYAGSLMAAERLQKQPGLAERIVGAAIGRPVRVTIRAPDRPRLAARAHYASNSRGGRSDGKRAGRSQLL